MDIFKATDAMKANQSKGKAWKNKKEKKSKSTRSYNDPYTIVTKSFDEDYTIKDVKRLYGFLNIQKSKINKYNVDKDGLPTETYIEWLDKGANAALTWTKEILKQNDIIKFNNTVDGDSNQEETGHFVNVSVSKSLNQELKQATFVVLEPHSSDDEFDLHEDTNSEDEVRKACHNFNTFCNKANLLHLVETETFAFVESYIAPTDFILGEEFVKKGTWLATIQVYDDVVWDLIKSGEFNGLSIQAFATTEYLDNE